MAELRKRVGCFKVGSWFASMVVMTAGAMSSGCAPVRMQFEPALTSCRQAAPAGGPAHRWVAPFDAGDRRKLQSWCDAVGRVVVHDAGPPAAGSADSAHADRAVIFVSWNMAVGKGDLVRLLDEARGDHAGAELIVLLQEAYRAKTVPGECPAGSGRTRALGLPRSPGSEDIVELAQRLGMHYAYAPSMRNGLDCVVEPREDRGNAILSTLALSDIAVIELPFAQQRRVALAARVQNGDRTLGVLSTHFDTVRGHTDMARGIAQTIGLLGWTGPLVVAGDFNSALIGDGGIREMRKHFVELDCGSGPTHGVIGRLDHVFIGLHDPPFACRTGTNRHGSDHSPLIAVMPAK
jgi:endonuclease/exonuclease/phosphatase family metal-dependent hydrolase